ncbi:MAG: glycosyltransferase [Candidatus Saganbacteria bacterium]|nr:glycosyltransferase [Candidatus Saganbacteria bacterium]
MKILQINTLSWTLPLKGYGGVERVIHWISKGLAELGHEVYVAALKGSISTYYKIIEIPLKPVGANYSRQDYIAAARYLSSRIPDGIEIIHGGSPGTGVSPVGDGIGEMRKYTKLPILVTTHGGGERLLPPEIATMSFISDSQRKLKGCPNAPFIYNPIDPDEFIYQPQKKDYLLWMSRVTWPEKRFDLAVEIAKRTGMKVVVAGPGMGWLRRLTLPKNMEYVGEVWGEKKAKLMAEARAFIHTATWNEPFGIVLVEANVSGTPVLAFRASGAIPEVVKDGVSGFTCDDFEDMVAKIGRLSEIKPQNCRDWAIENFHYKKIAAQYAELYKQLIARTD